MSLLESEFSECCIMDKKTRPDGVGGVITEWVDGAAFKAAITVDDSMLSQIAQQQAVRSIYKVTTRKSIVLRGNDVIKCGDRFFQITSDGTDKKTPESAGLDMRQVTAERWDLK